MTQRDLFVPLCWVVRDENDNPTDGPCDHTLCNDWHLVSVHRYKGKTNDDDEN